MVQLTCPCCGELIEVNPDKGGIVITSCLKDEDPPTAPPQGPFFDKTLHPPSLHQQSLETERKRFKKALGDLPIGSAGTELDEGSELPVDEEATYERDDQGKAITDINKIISDYPLEDDEDNENGE